MIEYLLLVSYGLIITIIIGLIILDRRLFKFRKYTIVTAMLIPLLIASMGTIYFNYELFKGMPKRSALPTDYWVLYYEPDEENNVAYMLILDKGKRVFYTEKYNKEKRKKIEHAQESLKKGQGIRVRFIKGEHNISIENLTDLPVKK